MKYLFISVSFLLVASTTVVNAETYAGIGFELGSAKHDLSSESFPTLILEGRLGYKFQNNFALELEATGTSGTSKSGEGTCQTNLPFTVPCTRTDEVKRQSVVIQGIYNWEVGKRNLFSSLGLGVITSSYKSTLNSAFSGSLDVIDEKSTDALISIEVGAIFNEKHRTSLVWNAPYGNSSTGEFSYFGLSYNYMFIL